MQLPENYAETPEGLLFIADGFSPMSRWDGIAASTLPVGVTPPASAPTLSASGVGTITGTYYGFVRFVNDRGAFSDLSPVSAPLVASGNSTVTYTNLAVSTQANVVRRQVLRNTAGQANVFYVDIDTTDLTSTSLPSGRTDSTTFALNAQPAVALFDDQGNPVANTNGLPPAHKCVVAAHLGRMFATVERTYNRGSVQVTDGSTLVQGVNTDWTASIAGRYLYVVGSVAPYQIASVDVANQVLTLSAAYWGGVTDPFASYAIRPAPAERRLVYYTQAGLVESWPAFNALSLQEDGDEITGLMVKGSFLYILEQRHVYRFTFQSDPAKDGFVFLAGVRGCVNNRCCVVVEDMAYMLDESGVHAYDGQNSEPISNPIQKCFQPYDSEVRVNWQASEYFHAAHSPAEEVIRWFVALSGEYLPRHALCYDYRHKRWWVEEFSRPIGCSATGTYQGSRRVFLGSSGNKTLLYAAGTLDGPDPSTGSTRGQVTGAALYSLTDSLAAWPPSGVVGHPVAIVSGKGAGQKRVVTDVSGTTLHVKTPWLVLPDSTSIYQLGGVQWEYRTGWFRFYEEEESSNVRRVEVLYEPTQNPATMGVKLYRDFAGQAVVWQRTTSAKESEGMASVKGSDTLLVDMTDQKGFAQQRLNSHKELNIRGPRYLQVGLSGVSSAEFQAVYQLRIDGVHEG